MTIPPAMQTATEWGSHLPALLACIASSEGAVLELGVGFFSTPHLHALCATLNRRLESWETDTEWFNEFHAKYTSPAHKFMHASKEFCEVLPALEAMRCPGLGVAFIDNSPGGANRADYFRVLVEFSDYVVVHDAQKDAENFQHIEPLLDGVNWYLCTGYFPHTLVCSKTKQIPAVLLGM